MKKKNTNNQPASEAKAKPVHVEFNHPTAATVSVAGSFNDWRPQATPLIPVGEGRWVKELALPPGTYEYRLVVDGEWIADPLAKETVPNPFGGVNSVLKANGCTS
jgi:1,4-alpha-glucan branching enzyme